MEPAVETVEACSVNIGPRGRAKRLRFGLVALVVAVIAAAALLALRAPPLSRLGLFVPFFLGGMGVFQARAKT
jgi:hypothetical protein